MLPVSRGGREGGREGGRQGGRANGRGSTAIITLAPEEECARVMHLGMFVYMSGCVT